MKLKILQLSVAETMGAEKQRKWSICDIADKQFFSWILFNGLETL